MGTQAVGVGSMAREQEVEIERVKSVYRIVRLICVATDGVRRDVATDEKRQGMCFMGRI